MTLLGIFIVDGVITKPTSGRFRKLFIRTAAECSYLFYTLVYRIAVPIIFGRLNTLFEPTNLEVNKSQKVFE